MRIQRREFISLLGGATAWPLAARAQQPQSPVIGFLNPFSPDGQTDRLRGFRQGLADAGYLEGVNLAIEYRWAEGHLARLPTLAAELVHRRVVLIAVTGGPTPAFAAKGATATIPIIFTVGDDPVRLGLVASLARPGGNVTGINFFANELAAKRLELLRELVPSATRIAVLVNPAEATNTESTLKDVDSAANAMGLQIKKRDASTSREINETFADFARERPDAIFIGPDAFFTARRVQLALLAAFHRLPVIYPLRPYTEAGGLMSYGSDIVDAYRQVGSYAGRILKGATPADLPVVRASKFELVINAETARTLGLAVSPSLLARADEVIE
jgi:putative tryptophan/tyrosine transport system substrate-binding protein